MIRSIGELVLLNDVVCNLTRFVANRVVGRECILRLGPNDWLDGRRGTIDSVLPHESHGFVYLVMVQNKRTGEFLNSVPETRQYRPAYEFVLVPPLEA